MRLTLLAIYHCLKHHWLLQATWDARPMLEQHRVVSWCCFARPDSDVHSCIRTWMIAVPIATVKDTEFFSGPMTSSMSVPAFPSSTVIGLLETMSFVSVSMESSWQAVLERKFVWFFFAHRAVQKWCGIIIISHVRCDPSVLFCAWERNFIHEFEATKDTFGLVAILSVGCQVEILPGAIWTVGLQDVLSVTILMLFSYICERENRNVFSTMLQNLSRSFRKMQPEMLVSQNQESEDSLWWWRAENVALKTLESF